MLMTNCYLTDSNKILKKIQHDLYDEHLKKMFFCTRSRFLKSASLLLHKTELVEKLEEVDSCDHRVLQESHDIIAARFRYLYDDGGQTELLSSTPQEKTYTQNWVDWFHQEIQTLVNYDDFCRAVANAVVFQNTEIGYSAERQIRDVLALHYSMDDWFLSN